MRFCEKCQNEVYENKCPQCGSQTITYEAWEEWCHYISEIESEEDEKIECERCGMRCFEDEGEKTKDGFICQWCIHYKEHVNWRRI